MIATSSRTHSDFACLQTRYPRRRLPPSRIMAKPRAGKHHRSHLTPEPRIAKQSNIKVRAWLQLGALAVMAAVACWLALAAFGQDPAAVRRAVTGLGAWGPIAYVALCVVLTVALFPFPPQAAAAGLLFGVAEGTFWAIIAGGIGAVAAFSVARRFGRAPVNALASPRARRLLDAVARRGFAGVLLIRVIPGVPRQPANWVCGLTPVGLLPFATANLIGMAPYAYAYVALGGNLRDFGNTQSLVATGLLVTFAASGVALLFLDRRSGRRSRRQVEGEDASRRSTVPGGTPEPTTKHALGGGRFR